MLERFDFKIEELILDGNNLCFRDDTFVGLDAVTALLTEIKGKFNKITILFDNSIGRKMKTGNQNIRKLLLDGVEGCDGIEVIISPPREPADQYIIRYASGKDRERAYVLSNDQFREYINYEVVSTRRVIPFRIVRNRLMWIDWMSMFGSLLNSEDLGA